MIIEFKNSLKGFSIDQSEQKRESENFKSNYLKLLFYSHPQEEKQNLKQEESLKKLPNKIQQASIFIIKVSEEEGSPGMNWKAYKEIAS